MNLTNPTVLFGGLSFFEKSTLDGLWRGLFEGRDEQMVFLMGSLALSSTAFWGMSLLFMLVDLTGRPTWIHRYKMQPGQNVPLPLPLFFKGLRRVAFNALVLNSLVGLALYPVFRALSGPLSRPLPSLLELLVHVAGFILVEEVGFYYSHRLFHHRLLYRHFHKIHHEWTAPVAMSAIYAHPLEHLLSNVGPVLLGPLLLRCHLATLWLWIVMALINTTYSHSGYHFPFTLPTEFHDFHHLKFTNNYGVLGLLDSLHGTDLLYRSSSHKRNARPYFSFTPPWLAPSSKKAL